MKLWFAFSMYLFPLLIQTTLSNGEMTHKYLVFEHNWILTKSIFATLVVIVSILIREGSPYDNHILNKQILIREGWPYDNHSLIRRPCSIFGAWTLMKYFIFINSTQQLMLLKSTMLQQINV